MDYEVIYFSKSSRQNTKKIAEAIADALKVTATRVTPEMRISKSKVLFLGTGVYMWHAGKDMRKFIDNFPQSEGQKVAIFMTHGGNNTEALAEMKTKLEEKGCNIIETWECLGEWAVFCKGHPTEQEIQNAREFAVEIAKNAENYEGVKKGELETGEETPKSL
ncbi:MAG: flavodoxin domain-containing protein [archaeon]